MKSGSRVSVELTSRAFPPSFGSPQPQLLLLFSRRNTVVKPPSTSPSPQQGQRLCPCRGVTTSPGNLGLALPPSPRLSQGDQFVHLHHLPNKPKASAQLFCACVGQKHLGLLLRGHWFNSSLHWCKEPLAELQSQEGMAVQELQALTPSRSSCLGISLWPLPCICCRWRMAGGGGRDFSFCFKKKSTIKRQNIEKIFIECKRKPSDQRPALDLSWKG